MSAPTLDPRTRGALPDDAPPGEAPVTARADHAAGGGATTLAAASRAPSGGTVVVPPADPDAPPQRRRSTSGFRTTDVLALVGAAVAGVALAALLFQVLPWNGALGFVVVAYLCFLGLYALVVSFDESGSAVRDRAVAVVVQSLAFLLLLGLIFVVAFTLIRGWQALTFGNFFVQDMQDAGPLDGLEVGGIIHAVVGTLWMIGMALVITIPLGLTCAVFLNEIPGGFTRFVRTIVEAMTALPSIIAGLFIYATFILILGFDKSGFAAALAISVMMLPIIIRAADVVIRLVPSSLKEASYAMGASQWRTVWHVVLPTSRSGLATAVILGTARGVGETSPVLLTAGFTAALNLNPFSGPMVSLPLNTFELVKSPQENLIIRGFGTAAVLMTLVLVLFVIARMIGGRGPGQLTARQRRRRVKQSQRDVERFDARAARDARAAVLSPSPPLPTVVDLRDPRTA